MTNLLQALETPQTPQGESNVDYVAWATEKFKTEGGELDVAALARGKWESDTSYVPKLLNELQEARKDAQTKASLEDFIDEYRNSQRTAQPNTPVISPVESQPNNSSISEADIERLVETKFTNKQREQIAQANIKSVRDDLTSKWGSGASEKYKARAKELEMSEDQLTNLAIQSPKAAINLLLGSTPASPPIAPGSYIPPRNNINPGSTLNTNGQHKTRRQWNEARRSMKASEYWTPDVQNAILADMTALGDRFDR